MKKRMVCMGVALAVCAAAFAEKDAAKDKRAAKRQIMVAVLGFDARKMDDSGLGGKIADLLTVFLSAEEGLQLVERAEIKKLLEEMALGKSGIVKADEAAKIGHMTGANVLVTGRAFVVGKNLLITGKVIGTETSRMTAKMVKGGLDQDLDEIVAGLATKIGTFIRQKGHKILAKIVTREERIGQIKKKLAGRKLPTFAVAIAERHVGRATIDPAAQTELQYILRQCGAGLLGVKELKLSVWAREYLKAKSKGLPPGLKRRTS